MKKFDYSKYTNCTSQLTRKEMLREYLAQPDLSADERFEAIEIMKIPTRRWWRITEDGLQEEV